VLSLIQAGMLQGKSIGFQILKGHHPDSKECDKNGWDPDRVCNVIDEWLLLEYAVCYLPCNPASTSVSGAGSMPRARARSDGSSTDPFDTAHTLPRHRSQAASVARRAIPSKSTAAIAAVTALSISVSGVNDTLAGELAAAASKINHSRATH
jgi:hypothetical protein